MRKFITDKLLAAQKYTTEKIKTEWVIFASDILMALLSLYVTLRLLLGKDIQTLQMTFILKHCLVFAFISLALFFLIRNEQGYSKYISMESIPGVMGCAVLANLFYHPLMLLMGNLPPLTPVLNTVLFMSGLLFPRLLAPFWKQEEIKTNTVELSPKIPIIVIGYNEQIGAYLRDHITNPKGKGPFPYQLIGIILNQPLSNDDQTPNFPILGMINDFVSIVQKLSLEGREPKRFLISQESLVYLPLRQILLKFQGRGILSLCFDISPATHEVTLRPLHIEDLLGKTNLNSSPQFSLEVAPYTTWQDVQSLIDSARILIIGINDPVIHQLAHHIVGFFPKHLILVDPSEHALAELKIKFDQLYPDVICEYILGSITDHDIIISLIESHEPQIIINGDRITHPDLIANNLLMTVQKNIFSPLYIAKCLQELGSCLFIQVNPQTPSLLSKIITTLTSQHLQAIDLATSKTHAGRCLVINCCDVWNNLDSTTAFWKEQLNQGLKITLPSPDAYSYLLSAQEAAQTILRAIVAALVDEKTKGQILHLSGGEPSRFLELIRSLALLNGLIPEIDAHINFSSKPFLIPTFEEAEVIHSLTPGVVIGTTNFSIQAQNNDLMEKLSDLVEKTQAVKLVALLEKINVGVDTMDFHTPLKLAG